MFADSERKALLSPRESLHRELLFQSICVRGVGAAQLVVG